MYQDALMAGPGTSGIKGTGTGEHGLRAIRNGTENERPER